MHLSEAKAAVMTGAAVIGGMISQAFGGLDAALITLLIFMAVDYVSGLIVAGVFQASDKSEKQLRVCFDLKSSTLRDLLASSRALQLKTNKTSL